MGAKATKINFEAMQGVEYFAEVFYHEVSDEWNFYVGIFVRYFGT